MILCLPWLFSLGSHGDMSMIYSQNVLNVMTWGSDCTCRLSSHNQLGVFLTSIQKELGVVRGRGRILYLLHICRCGHRRRVWRIRRARREHRTARYTWGYTQPWSCRGWTAAGPPPPGGSTHQVHQWHRGQRWYLEQGQQPHRRKEQPQFS